MKANSCFEEHSYDPMGGSAIWEYRPHEDHNGKSYTDLHMVIKRHYICLQCGQEKTDKKEVLIKPNEQVSIPF